MPTFVGEPDDHLERVSVDFGGVEVPESDLRAPEQCELLAVHFAPREVEKAILTAAVHVRPAQASPPHGELHVSDELLVAGRSRHHLLATLQPDMDVRVAVGTIR